MSTVHENWLKFLKEQEVEPSEVDQAAGRRKAKVAIEQLIVDLSRQGYTEAADILHMAHLQLLGHDTSV